MEAQKSKKKKASLRRAVMFNIVPIVGALKVHNNEDDR